MVGSGGRAGWVTGQNELEKNGSTIFFIDNYFFFTKTMLYHQYYKS